MRNSIKKLRTAFVSSWIPWKEWKNRIYPFLARDPINMDAFLERSDTFIFLRTSFSLSACCCRIQQHFVDNENIIPQDIVNDKSVGRILERFYETFFCFLSHMLERGEISDRV